MLFDSTREKQRWILFAVLLFLVFDFSVLALNYWLSLKIEKEAIAINLAGRQRMLSQRMVNSLLNIELASQRGNDTAPYLSELKTTFKLFDDTLIGFRTSHLTFDGNNQPVYLEPLNQPVQLKLLHKADVIWQPYRLQIMALLANELDLPKQQEAEQCAQQLSNTVTYASKYSAHLLNLMNDLTSNLQNNTQLQTERIRTYQACAFLLALLNFFGIFYMFSQRIRQTSRSNLMLNNIINKVTVSVLIIDSNNHIIDSNLTAQTLFQYEKSELSGKNLAQFLETHANETIAKCKDGSQFRAVIERNQIKLDNEEATILSITDITKQHEKEQHLSQMAHHDTLTGLPNRILFDDRLSLEINHMRRDNSLLAVMFIDLDRFKPINDNYGHSAGDEVLKQIAQRISLCLHDIDTVSRRGGDEFTVILSGIKDIADCEKIARTILNQLASAFVFNNQHISASASIGISLYPMHGQNSDELLLQADAAMYQAKAKGGNQICMCVMDS